MQDHIYVKGARENNLKNVDVTIPRDKLVVLTGLSAAASPPWPSTPSMRGPAAVCGVPVLLRPDVPGTDGEAGRGLHRRLSPAISIDQKTTSKNPRSTVAR